MTTAASVPTATLYAQVNVMTSTAQQATGAQVTVASMVGSGLPAYVLTGVTGATLGIPDAVVVVLPPPPPSNAPLGRPPPPPPLAFIVLVNVSVPFVTGVALAQANVTAALAAIATVLVPSVPGATPPSFFVSEIRVETTLAVRGFGSELTQLQINAVAQTLPFKLGVTNQQLSIASGATAAGGVGSNVAPPPLAGGGSGGGTAFIAVTVRGLPNIATVAQGVARALGTPGVLGAVQFAVAAAATAAPTGLNVSLGPSGASAVVVVTAQAGAFYPAAATAAVAAITQALSEGAPPALVRAGFPATVAGVTVSGAIAGASPLQPALPPPPPLASTVEVSVGVLFSPASALTPATVSLIASTVTGAISGMRQGAGYLPSPSVFVAGIAVTAQLAVASPQPPSPVQLAAAVQAIAEALSLDPTQVLLVASASPTVVTVTVRGVSHASNAASIARSLAGQFLASRVGEVLMGARNVSVAPTGVTRADVVVTAALGVTSGAAAGNAGAALLEAMGSPRLRSALVAGGFAAPSAPTDPVVTLAASPPPPASPRPPAVSLPPAPAGSTLTNADRLAAIMAAADDLANSIMDSLAPGQSAAVFVSDQLQIAVQVDLSPSARLTTQSISAPGSSSVFNPLPAAALAGTAPGSIIRTMLISAVGSYPGRLP